MVDINLISIILNSVTIIFLAIVISLFKIYIKDLQDIRDDIDFLAKKFKEQYRDTQKVLQSPHLVTVKDVTTLDIKPQPIKKRGRPRKNP